MFKRGRKVGLFLILEKNGYQQATAEAAQETARRYGIELVVRYAEGLAVQQSQDILHFVHENAGKEIGVLVQPVVDIDPRVESVGEHALHKLARRVAAKGAAWIVLNRSAARHIEALRQEFPLVPAGLFNADQRGFGLLQGRQFKALLPRGGHLLYVLGSSLASACRERKAGMVQETAIAGFTIHEVEGGWVADRAREAVHKWLLRAGVREVWPGLIGCQNDEMAMGSREALIRAARDLGRPELAEVLVTGGDGLPEMGQKWVGDRRLAATVVMPALGGIAVEALVRHWDGKRTLPVQTVVPVHSHPAVEHLGRPRATRSAGTSLALRLDDAPPGFQ